MKAHDAPEPLPPPAPPWYGTVWRGMVMGIAEVVPGVSGGTIALITGIYPLLITSLARFGLASLGLLYRPVEFARVHNLWFLVLLGAGMLLGVLAFGRLMHYLLAEHTPLVWAFFSGVILCSVWVLGVQRRAAVLWFWAPGGCLAGLALLMLPVVPGDSAAWYVFLAGAVAVCAWILPAVSGSYVMVLLGLYPAIIAAIDSLDVQLLAVLAAGCATGLLAFVRVVAWLLRHHGERLLSFLTGFMLGSVPNLWPWQLALTDGASAGLRKLDLLVLPDMFATHSGAAPEVAGSVVCLVAGVVVVWRLSAAGAARS